VPELAGKSLKAAKSLNLMLRKFASNFKDRPRAEMNGGRGDGFA
jgi:hypothetical protein